MLRQKDFFNSERKTRLLLLAALFVSSLLIYRQYLFGGQLLVFNDIGSDTQQQYAAQLYSIISHLREGTFSLWDFTNGFGVNQFNLNLFDPSLMLVYLTGWCFGFHRALYALTLVQILRILAAGWLFYLFVSCFSFDQRAKAAASYSYGLCSYLMVWGQHYQFGMAVVYLPLLLLFLERTIQKRRSGRFLPVAVFLSCIYSAFFSYMSLLTAGLYLVGRLLMEEGEGKERLRLFVQACLRILLGIGLSMVIFLPMALCLLHVSGRISEGNPTGLSLWENYLRPFDWAFYRSLFLRFFSSNLQEIQGKTEIIRSYANYYEDPVLFLSVPAVFLNVQFLPLYWRRTANKRRRGVVTAAACLLLFAIFLPAVGTVYNAGNYYASRFVYVLIPFELLAFAWTWEQVQLGERLSRVALALTALVMTAAYAIGYAQSVFSTARLHAAVLLGDGLLCFFLLWYLAKKNLSERRRGQGRVALLFLMAVSQISEGWASYASRISLDRWDTPEAEVAALQAAYDADGLSGDPVRIAEASLRIPQGYFTALHSENMRDLLADLREEDPEFFRMEKDFASMTYYMDSMMYGYYGVSTYNTVQNKYVWDFVETCCPQLEYEGRRYYFSFRDLWEDSDLAAFLGIRYFVSRSAVLNPEKYELVRTYGDLCLYRNRTEASLGRFYTRAISEEEFRAQYPKADQETFLRETLALPQEALTETGLSEEEVEEDASFVRLMRPKRDSLVEGSIHAESDGYALFLIPYEDGWSLTLDGEEEELLCGDLGFFACRVPAGDHRVVLRFCPPGLVTGAKISLILWGLTLIWLFWSLHRDRKGRTMICCTEIKREEKA